jgi:hypothetical protein
MSEEKHDVVEEIEEKIKEKLPILDLLKDSRILLLILVLGGGNLAQGFDKVAGFFGIETNFSEEVTCEDELETHRRDLQGCVEAIAPAITETWKQCVKKYENED